MVKAEEEVQESELGKVGLHRWDRGPGQALSSRQESSACCTPELRAFPWNCL